ncbi:MAG: hypothetical protein ACYTEQ_05260 [Planctomycetota bacterium]|jgi:hypothetical protein
MSQELLGNIVLFLGTITSVIVVLLFHKLRKNTWPFKEQVINSRQSLDEIEIAFREYRARMGPKRACKCYSCPGIIEWSPVSNRYFCFECGAVGRIHETASSECGLTFVQNIQPKDREEE